MKSEEVNKLRSELTAAQRELDEHRRAVGTIQRRLIAAKAGSLSIPKAELPQLSSELAAHGKAIDDATDRGLKIYSRLKKLGFGTRELDEWYRDLMEQSGQSPAP